MILVILSTYHRENFLLVQPVGQLLNDGSILPTGLEQRLTAEILNPRYSSYWEYYWLLTG